MVFSRGRLLFDPTRNVADDGSLVFVFLDRNQTA